MSSQIAGKQPHHIHISSKHNWWDLKLKEVWQYRDLIWLFTKRSFTLSYKQTVLGPIWIVITPLLSSLIYTFVFGTVAGMSTDGIPQVLFYLSGTALWAFFAGSLTGNANVFRTNASVFGKVYFPRLTSPISNVLSGVFQFLIQMILVVALLVYYVICGEVSPNWWALVFLPLILIHMGVLGMGLGLIVSSFTTKYRDLSVFVGYGVSLLMYATPVVYPLSQLEEGLVKTIVRINPITSPMELFRYALVGSGSFNAVYYAISVAVTLLVALLAIMVFNHTEKTFMDTV